MEEVVERRRGERKDRSLVRERRVGRREAVGGRRVVGAILLERESGDHTEAVGGVCRDAGGLVGKTARWGRER